MLTLHVTSSASHRSRQRATVDEEGAGPAPSRQINHVAPLAYSPSTGSHRLQRRGHAVYRRRHAYPPVLRLPAG
jgi:hypothetical protein